MAKSKTTRLRLRNIYTTPGKPNMADLVDKCGCYVIFYNGVARYVGYSSTNLYKTISRHFQDWSSSKQITRVTYQQIPGFTLRVYLTSCQNAPILETALIDKYKPVDNPRIKQTGRNKAKESEILSIAENSPLISEAPF